MHHPPHLSLVEVNTRLPHADLHAVHQPVLAILVPLIERGQRDGTFRGDVPVAWHLSMPLALIHAASSELSAGRMPQAAVEAALVRTVLRRNHRALEGDELVPAVRPLCR